MSAIDPIQAQLPISPAAGAGLKPPRTIRQAGEQFESLLIAELLRMTHGEEGSWLGAGEDPASSCAMGLADESLAGAISSQGGFGLGKLVTESLASASRAEG